MLLLVPVPIVEFEEFESTESVVMHWTRRWGLKTVTQHSLTHIQRRQSDREREKGGNKGERDNRKRYKQSDKEREKKDRETHMDKKR